MGEIGATKCPQQRQNKVGVGESENERVGVYVKKGDKVGEENKTRQKQRKGIMLERSTREEQKKERQEG